MKRVTIRGKRYVWNYWEFLGNLSNVAIVVFFLWAVSYVGYWDRILGVR